jgi:hypothetical protein
MNDRPKLKSKDVQEAAYCPSCRGTVFRTEQGEGSVFPSTLEGMPGMFGKIGGAVLREPLVCVSCGAHLSSYIDVPPGGAVGPQAPQ